MSSPGWVNRLAGCKPYALQRDGISNCSCLNRLLNHSGIHQRKHQSSWLLAFVRGIHKWPVDSPHKGPVMQKIFQFDDVIMSMVNIMGRHLDQKWPAGWWHQAFAMFTLPNQGSFCVCTQPMREKLCNVVSHWVRACTEWSVFNVYSSVINNRRSTSQWKSVEGAMSNL